jgi:hypothetical protein
MREVLNRTAPFAAVFLFVLRGLIFFLSYRFPGERIDKALQKPQGFVGISK